MKICDKCGNKLPNELSNTEYPQYAVMEMLSPIFCHAVDLCNDCMKELYKWLRTMEGKE